jgi:putative peptidoglycan lipid II flippase
LRIVQTAFFALRDARTPLKAAGAGMAVNLILGAVLMHPLGHKGIALATACAAVVNLAALLVALRRKLGTLGGPTVTRAFFRAACCSALMGLMVTRLLHWMRFEHQASLSVAALQLFVCVAAGVGVYLLLAWCCRSRELRMVCRIVYQKGLAG